MKDFDEGKFIEELLKQHWEYVYFLACGKFGKNY
jgi:hypothetical protein